MCSLTLISSPHLARSYHHLFPVPAYQELPPESAQQLADAVTSGTSPRQLAESLAAQQQASQQQQQAGEDGPGVQGAGQQGQHDSQPPAPRVMAALLASAHAQPCELPHALYCFGCLRDLTPASASQGAAGGRAAAPPMVLHCGRCHHLFCFDCDSYVHESLHNCPGCESRNRGAAAATPSEGWGVGAATAHSPGGDSEAMMVDG